MTRDEFKRKFQGRFLLFLTEAWMVRKESPSSLGMVMDDHARSLRGLLDEVYDALNQKESLNGVPGAKRVPAQG